MDNAAAAVASQLEDWFRDISRILGERLFGVVPEGPHRDAVIVDVMRRNARIVSRSELDREGKLYSPLCLFLAAACRMLRLSLDRGHWGAAVDDVIRLEEQAASARADSAAVGLDIGSPATFFKNEFEEAINQAGVTSGASYLDQQDREIALGLAVNWTMRLLPAYALECRNSLSLSDRRDLAWVAQLLQPLLTVPEGAHK